MKKVLALFVVFALALVGTACNNSSQQGQTQSSEENITVEHQLGKTELSRNPDKVVVFDFGVLDTLDQLGIEVAALPKSNVPNYLSKYEGNNYENAGTLKEPDFEKLSEINPDLIIISGRQQDLYQEFQKIAPTIFMGVDYNDFMGSFEKNMQTLGKIFGKEKEIEQELVTIRSSIENLKQKAAASKKTALIVLANDNKVSAYGPKSRFGLIHDVFGLTAADSSINASTHGQSISFEYIVEKNPDYLYVVDRSAAVTKKASAKQTIENELVKKTKAYQNGNIVYLDPNIWYLSGGGLQSVSEMISEIDKSMK
ncbi:siderophore ABC transporter substrate-binding protein [Thermoactinomyces mirandus]|uniref:Siderophore ABC transporter substrate-binding protein n=1 Tax=Thermoactinomyces mirandus TaxID=2756294 RepID=A0A7W2ARD9_9BACL|nr:siderophore ABC transporter substrate-binding protein [Thermoactinomyces mirandus]MBA4602242.1 siderophore ABC transporter substrate-binding protein [Thermoactinomyces mirandus]